MSSNAFSGYNKGYDSDAIFKHRDENMCSEWRNVVQQEFLSCSIKASANKTGNYVFNGALKDYLSTMARSYDVYLQYWAPNKTDRRYSFNGSGLPFPNEEVAFQDTSNKGVIRVLGGQFQFNLEYPNSYYSQMGKKLNPPLVKFRFCDSNGKALTDVHTVILGHSIPFRSLNWTKKRNFNDGPLFYYNPEMPQCRNQYQILYDSRYPDETLRVPANFWGTKPPR